MDEPISTAQRCTDRPLRGLDRYRSQIALVAGTVAAGMGLLAWWSFGYTGNDEFFVMYYICIASSFVAWLASILSVSLSVLSIRNGAFVLPWFAIGLSCVGFAITVFTGMPLLYWFVEWWVRN